jgi:peptidyl-prolyl cis-trans isomerase A (cyclophilin A)
LEFEKVPMTVASFVGLAEGNFEYDTVVITKPYYDGLKFHRVVADFMIQGGDPAGNGSGGPGYSFPDEFDSTLTHTGPGILSMANAGPATNGSQFFITHKATPHLNFKHSVFGHVVAGQNVVNSIKQNDIIESVTIIRVGKKAKKFNATQVFNAKVIVLREAAIAELKARNATFAAEMLVKYPTAIQRESGLMYEITKQGNGIFPQTGESIEVHYNGYFPDGKKFDSSIDRGQPFTFLYNKGRVIKGWDEGIGLASIGGEIRLIVPYWLAYGEAGRSSIPPKATLIFDVQVISSKAGQ